MNVKRNHRNLVWVIMVIIGAVCLNGTAVFGAEVRGSQSGRWTISGSPYVVTGNVVIPAGATLTIEPGVIIQFAGYYSFKISGTLRALGTATNRIVFTSADDSEFNESSLAIANPATVNDWAGIEFTDSSNDEQSRFENCVIRYCTLPLVLTQAAPRTLESLTISNCSSKTVNLNGQRVAFQDGVEQDYLLKDAVYQAAAPITENIQDSTVNESSPGDLNNDAAFHAATPIAENSEDSTMTAANPERTSAAPFHDNDGTPATNADTAMLQGVVADAETQASLSGASIEIVSLDGKITQGTASGANGEFEFQNLAPGLYQVTVSSLGYARQTVDDIVLAPGEFKALDIPLTHAGIEFNPAALTATRRPEKILAAPAAVAVIAATPTQVRSTLIAAEHLKTVPGVDFAGAGLNHAFVALRGFNNVSTGAPLLLTDYRLAQLPALRVNAFNLLPTTNEDIERIEIVSGPASALYGPNSANGVMHLITKSPFGSEGTVFSAGGGERVSFLGTMRHARSFNNRLGFKISGQYYKGKDWENYDSQEPDSFMVAGNKVRAPGRDFNVEKIGGEGRLDYRLTDDLTAIMTAGYSRVSDITLTGLGAMQTKNFGYSFWQGRLLYKNLFAQAAVNRIHTGSSYWRRTGMPVVDKSSMYAGQIQHELALGWRQRFTYGADLVQTRPDSRGLIYGRYEYQDHIDEIGAFLQSETKLSPKLDFIGALRVDHHNRLQDNVLSPRAALIYNLTADQKLRLTYNRGFTTPTTNNFFLDLTAGNVPQTPYLLRALGVPDKTGFTFRRGNDGRPQMISPFMPAAGYLPPTANAVWPALRQILLERAPANLQALLNSALPAELDTEVNGDLRTLNPATGGFDLAAEVKDVAPLKPTLTTTIEAGYKGLLREKIFLAVDVYRTQVKAFGSSLMVETPNVFANPQQLATALQPATTALTNALMEQGISPEQAQAQATTIINGLVDTATQIPFGVISPQEIANGTDLILTYRNFGDIAFTGADFSLIYHANQNWKFSGNYSFVSHEFFPKNATTPYDLALNAPQHKFGLSVQYGNLPNGLDTELRVRYVEGFPVNSGVYAGAVQTYTVLDLDCDYDLSHKTKFLFAVQNIFDRRYREFTGAPILGRLIIARLSRTL